MTYSGRFARQRRGQLPNTGDFPEGKEAFQECAALSGAAPQISTPDPLLPLPSPAQNDASLTSLTDTFLNLPFTPGNGTRVPLSETALQHNELRHDSTTESANWPHPHTECPLCLALALPSDELHASSLLHVAERWETLPPQIREAIVTLVDAASFSTDHTSRGGSS